jgi:hypothetical protein
MGLSGTKALAGAGTGAAAGSAFGPYGAAIGAGIGGLAGLFSGGGGSKKNKYDPNQAAFQTPAAAQYFGQGGAGDFWAQQGNVQAPEDKYINWARDDARFNQTRQGEGLDYLQQYATGQKSAAMLAGQAGLERTQRAIAAQAASAPGGFNPAMQRASMYAQSQAGQEMSAQMAAEVAREQMAAQQAYLNAVGQARGQDQAQMGQEAAFWAQQGNRDLALEQIRQNYLRMGMDDRQATQAALMQYENLKSGHSIAQGGLDLQASQQGQADRQYWTNLGVAGISATGQGLASYYASQPGKNQGGYEGELYNPWKPKG